MPKSSSISPQILSTRVFATYVAHLILTRLNCLPSLSTSVVWHIQQSTDEVRQISWLLRDSSRCLSISISSRVRKPWFVFDSNRLRESRFEDSTANRLTILSVGRPRGKTCNRIWRQTLKPFSPEGRRKTFFVTAEWLLEKSKVFYFEVIWSVAKAPVAFLELSYFQHEEWSHGICVTAVRSVARRLN